MGAGDDGIIRIRDLIALAPATILRLVETFDPPIEVYRCPTCGFRKRCKVPA